VVKENLQTAIEKMLGFDFVSDPRGARFPIPEIPVNHPADRPFPYPAMTITPEMARDVLMYRVIRLERIPASLRHEEMVTNRRFLVAALKGSPRDKGWLRKFTDNEMHPGTAQPVCFTRDGYLLDGQHRFAACCLTGIPFEVPVTVNTPWSTFAITDSGRGRTPGQLLGDIPYPDNCASAAKLILPVLSGSEGRNWIDASAGNQDIYDLVHGWPIFQGSWPDGEAPWLKHVLAASRSRVPLAPLAASTMMALAAGADAFHVAEFLEGLKPGYKGGHPDLGPYTSDPRHMLRSSYLNAKTGGKGNAREKRRQVAHVRRAMEVWLDFKTGRKLHRISNLPTWVNEDSDLPQVWNADAVREYHRERVS
jgi:hypothetical protein